MTGFSWIFTLLAANAAAPDATPSVRPTAPDASCIDTRAVTEARHLDERLVLLRIDDARYRLELSQACPASHDEPLVALAPHGWLCGGRGELLRVGDRTCAIGRVAPLDDRDWALALRDHARKNPLPTLATLTVDAKAQPKRRFAASPEYCVDPRRVRGWNASGSDIVLQTKPRPGSKESGSYRLEFAGGCPQAGVGTQMTLVSGMGMGWVCGNPGDRAIISDAWTNGSTDATTITSPLPGGFIRGGCLVTAVYPE